MKDVDGNHSFNLFGIKASAAWDGQTVNKKTLEYRNGIAAPEFAAFRSYASLGSAFDDYVKFLKTNPRYQNALQLNIEAKQWGYALQKAGYATDPNYGNKIASLLESDILQAKASATTTL
jgi:flagellar protein FlgJ